jgi:hypothetical protein
MTRARNVYEVEITRIDAAAAIPEVNGWVLARDIDDARQKAETFRVRQGKLIGKHYKLTGLSFIGDINVS